MKRPYHHWTTRELHVLRSVYPAGGVRAVIPHLPHRSKASVYAMTEKLGLARTFRKAAA